MRVTALAAAVLAASTAFADLDRIDANGVTERGGSPAYARMLPRTGTNGLLSATLLPPVADWASQPVPRLYWAAAGASSQGNGSPQYPFNTLSHAVSNMSSNAALVLAPGTYSGVCEIQSGRTVTLFGEGRQSYVSSLTVTALGSSSSTMLELCNMRVGTLQVLGGRINIRLAGTTVAQMGGSASPVTVTRADMGARIDAYSLGHLDSYAGYATAPRAEATVNDDEGLTLLLSGGRAVVMDTAGEHKVAYLSDIDGATNGIDAAIADLRATNTATMAAVASETAARTAADQALSNNLAAVISVLSSDLGSIDATWGSNIGAINSRLTQLDNALTDLRTLEAADVSTLSGRVSQVSSGYAAADAALNSTLRSVIASGLNTLRADVPDLAASRATAIADARIAATSNSIINTAVSRANTQAIARETIISNRVSSLQGAVSSLQTTVSGHTTSIAQLGATNTAVQARISTLQSTVGTHTSDIASLRSAVTQLQSWRTTTEAWKSTTNADIATIKNRINSIIDSMASITGAVRVTTVTLPAKF